MGRITQQSNQPIQPIQASEVKSVCQSKSTEKIKEIKQIPLIEKPVAIHNLSEQIVVNKPILPPTPIIIEIDPATVPQMIITSPVNHKEIVQDVNIVKEEPIKVEIKKTISAPVPLKLEPTVITSPAVENTSSFVLPDNNKPAKFEEECLGRKLSPGDIVDGDILPPSDKKWNPDAKNKTIRWFDMQWKSDGNYELINWCVFMTHMELELRKL